MLFIHYIHSAFFLNVINLFQSIGFIKNMSYELISEAKLVINVLKNNFRNIFEKNA